MLRAYIFLAGAGAGAAAAAAAFVFDLGAAAAMDDDFLAAGFAAGFDFLAAFLGAYDGQNIMSRSVEGVGESKSDSRADAHGFFLRRALLLGLRRQ